MNLYILVEGKQTERKLYPAWVCHLSPKIKKVDVISQITENCLYLISGEGYPRLLDVTLVNSLKDISQNEKITNFWVVLDADEQTVEQRREQVLERIEKSGIDIAHCAVEVIVQNPCIETWGLGNKIIISPNKISPDFGCFFQHFDVQNNDPELMQKPYGHDGSIAHYHECYLKAMLKLRNATYTKKNPATLMEAPYLEQLVVRANDGRNHLSSFNHFLQLASNL